MRPTKITLAHKTLRRWQLLNSVNQSGIVDHTFQNLSHFAADVTAFTRSCYYIALAPLLSVVAQSLHIVAYLPQQTDEG